MNDKEQSFESLKTSLPSIDQLRECIDDYDRDGRNAKQSIDTLRQTRMAIVKWLSTQTEHTVIDAFSSNIRLYTGVLMSGDFALMDLSFNESDVYNQVLTIILKNPVPAPQLIFMMMILRPSYKAPMIDFDAIPQWLIKEFILYITRVFKLLRTEKCINSFEKNYKRYLEQIISYSNRPQKIHDTIEISYQYLSYSCFINLYALPTPTSPVWAMRADIMEELLRLVKGSLSSPIKLQPEPSHYYRVGILASNFCASTEGYFALSHWHDLPRDQFHVTLFSMQKEPRGLEHYAKNRADDYIALDCTFAKPDELTQVVDRIRAAKLDLLIVAGNTSVAFTTATLSSAHRLARIQIMNSATPVTTGFRAMDGYLSADFNERPDGQNDYTEKLMKLPGSVSFYAYHFDHTSQSKPFDHESLGLPKDKVLVFCGGNFFKLTPSTLRIWAQLIKRCPNAHLVMMPFSPGWLDGVFPAGPMYDLCRDIFVTEGVDPNSLTIIPTVPTRTDRHAIMALCDVYIDSFPFAGACSMLDPFLAGLPVVAYRFEHFRGLLAASMLQEVGLEDMAVQSDDAYLDRAAKLINDPDFRLAESQRIWAVRNKGLPFFDTVTYGKRLGNLFINVLTERQEKDRALLAMDAPTLLGHLKELTDRLTAKHNPFFSGLDDHQLMEIIIAGYFSTQPDAKPGYMIDVGGCIGKMALPMLKQGWQVDLMEPDPACNEHLIDLRAEFNGQLEYFITAVSDVHGEMISFHQADTGLSGLGTSPYCNDHQTLSVLSVRLDKFIAEMGINAIDVLKIDAEGYDFIALDSMGWDHLPPIHWPRLIMLEFGSNFAPQPLTTITAKITEMAARGYGALVFSYDDDGNFAHKIWQHRLIDLTVDAPVCNKAGIASGNIIFYRADNTAFLAYVLRQLAGMLHACDRPDWA